jgi:hypothetical protein
VSGHRGWFDPSELRTLESGTAEPGTTDAELADALLIARELESLAAGEAIRPSDGFEDRVMAAIALEPAPRLVVRRPSAGRAGRVTAFLVAVGDAWRVASTGGRPAAVRAQALAFVLLVLLAAGALTTVTAVGVGALLQRNGQTTPSFTPAPTVGPTTSETAVPSESPDASDSPEPSETPEATEAAEGPGAIATPKSAETAKPTATSRPTRTPRPTQTPHAEDTQKPGETPNPTEIDDHGGGCGGGSGPG